MGYYEEARALLPYLSALRREFHRHPCVSREEFWTAERIEAELDAIGVTDHRRIDGTGVLASLRGALPGDRAMALRADIDALSIQEENCTLSYCSQQPGTMHACGHDAHTAGLLGAAKLLYSHRDELSGEVRFLFQHAEEIGYGAKQFIKAGALEGVSRVFGIHMAPDLPCGRIGIRPGPNNASVDHFTIEIQGKAAHVSTPNLGVDALYIASQLVVALQALVTRRTAPVDPVIVGVGRLSAGTSYNIVAGSAVLEGTTRAFSPRTRTQVNSELEALCHAVAQAYGGSATVAWEDFASPLVNPSDICREAAEVAGRLFGPDTVTQERPLSCGGDDFAEYQALVPGVYAYVGSADQTRPDTCLPLHNGRFDLDEDSLPIIAALHATYAAHYLSAQL